MELWTHFTKIRRADLIWNQKKHSIDQIGYYDEIPFEQGYCKPKQISVTKSGHLVIMVSRPGKFDKNSQVQRYYAYNPKTKLVDVRVNGSATIHKNGFTTLIPHVSAREHNTIKAHNFYHHLITEHNLIFCTSGAQSIGGKKVWQALKKNHNDISIYGAYDANMFGIDLLEDEDLIWNSDYVANPYEETRYILDTNLIAHKKI